MRVRGIKMQEGEETFGKSYLYGALTIAAVFLTPWVLRVSWAGYDLTKKWLWEEPKN